MEWCRTRHIEPARTMPYHKNDNCYAEQKNDEAVEQLLKLNREKGYTGNPPCQGGGGQAPAA
jgi:hypothetical protein